MIDVEGRENRNFFRVEAKKMLSSIVSWNRISLMSQKQIKNDKRNM